MVLILEFGISKSHWFFSLTFIYVAREDWGWVPRESAPIPSVLLMPWGSCTGVAGSVCYCGEAALLMHDQLCWCREVGWLENQATVWMCRDSTGQLHVYFVAWSLQLLFGYQRLFAPTIHFIVATELFVKNEQREMFMTLSSSDIRFI